MAKKSMLNRNAKRRAMAAHQAPIRKQLKEKALDHSYSPEERYAARRKLQDLHRNGAKCRIRNRCQVTGRPRGNFSKFMISRMVLREIAHQGFIPGMTKASW